MNVYSFAFPIFTYIYTVYIYIGTSPETPRQCELDIIDETLVITWYSTGKYVEKYHYRVILEEEDVTGEVYSDRSKKGYTVDVPIDVEIEGTYNITVYIFTVNIIGSSSPCISHILWVGEDEGMLTLLHACLYIYHPYVYSLLACQPYIIHIGQEATHSETMGLYIHIYSMHVNQTQTYINYNKFDSF